MRRLLIMALLPLTVGGCAAFVPDLEPESTFSYAEIVSQLECETYYTDVFLTINQDDKNNLAVPDSDHAHLNAFDQWAMDISITPNLSYEEGLSIGGMSKSSLKTHWFQIASGGAASPGGSGYDMYGTANAKNEYQFAIAKLFADSSDPDGQFLSQKNADGTIVKVHRINHKLAQTCQPSSDIPVDEVVRHLIATSSSTARATQEPSPAPTAVPNVLDGKGFFGVYDYIKRSFAVNNILALQPTKTLTYQKEYRVKVQIGATPGWFGPYANISPAVGGIRIVDNTISLAFAPPPGPEPGPTKVIVVGTAPAPTKGVTLAPARPAAPSNGVSQRQSDTLTNSINNLNLNTIQNQLNRLQ